MRKERQTISKNSRHYTATLCEPYKTLKKRTPTCFLSYNSLIYHYSAISALTYEHLKGSDSPGLLRRAWRCTEAEALHLLLFQLVQRRSTVEGEDRALDSGLHLDLLTAIIVLGGSVVFAVQETLDHGFDGDGVGQSLRTLRAGKKGLNGSEAKNGV